VVVEVVGAQDILDRNALRIRCIVELEGRLDSVFFYPILQRLLAYNGVVLYFQNRSTLISIGSKLAYLLVRIHSPGLIYIMHFPPGLCKTGARFFFLLSVRLASSFVSGIKGIDDGQRLRRRSRKL
jgi:hypothetical protein